MTVVLPDPEADRWYSMAVFGFWLRHREALEAMPPKVPEGLVAEQESFRRLGWELTVLESDLANCVHELYTAFESLYADPNVLFRKKFAVVYHIDNFYVRVHKLIDNLYRLVAMVADIEPRARDAQFRRELKMALMRKGIKAIAELLRTLEKKKWIRQAKDARNLFVHLYRDEPKWPMLSPRERFYQSVGGYDDLAEQTCQITDPDRLDHYAERKAEELLQTLSVIREFRDQLHDAFVENLVQLTSTMSAEVQEFVRHATDLYLQDILEDLGEVVEPPLDDVGGSVPG